MENPAIVKVLRSTPKWWTVSIAGTADDTTIDELIRGYQEILRMGIHRACLDLTQTNPEFTLVHRRTADVLQVALKLQRVAVLVSGAKTAFAIKAATKAQEDGFRVFYNAAQMKSWLEE